MRKLAAEELFDYAVKYLAQRSCSSDELRARLRGRAAQVTDIDAAIERLKGIGYLNDERFAESFASSRVENDGFGRMRVLNDLRSRRVPAKVADKAVAEVFSGRDEAALVTAYIERRMPSLAAGEVADERKIAAAYRRLRRAGFSAGHTLAALKRIARHAEILDEAPEEESAEDV